MKVGDGAGPTDRPDRPDQEDKMAAGVVPPKGEPTFCEEACQHTDCARWRAFFESSCAECGEGFEHGQRFYEVDVSGVRVPVHGLCYELRIEAR